MPIVDIELVADAADAAGTVTAQALAEVLGQALGSTPARTWVRLHRLDPGDYAENGATLGAAEWPTFVTMLHSRLPAGAALRTEVAAVTQAVALCLGRSAQRVHVLYAPAAAGRQAFGGRLME